MARILKYLFLMHLALLGTTAFAQNRAAPREVADSVPAATTRDADPKANQFERKEIDVITHNILVTERKLESIDSDIKKLIVSVSDRFIAQTTSILQTVVSIFTVFVTASITIGIFFINYIIPKVVERAHEEELEKTQNKLTQAIKEEAAKIYSMFGGHCINLYKDLQHPFNNHRKALYESYLDIAVDMSKFGYENCNEMASLIEKIGRTESKDQERTIAACLNNYIYYLAERRGDNDKVLLGSLLPKLRELIEKHQSDPLHWDLEDTLAWAEVRLGQKDGKATRLAVERFLNEPTISDAWKKDLCSRYQFHDAFLGSTDSQRVGVK